MANEALVIAYHVVDLCTPGCRYHKIVFEIGMDGFIRDRLKAVGMSCGDDEHVFEQGTHT